MTPPIHNSETHGPIDATYGYNDFLVTLDKDYSSNNKKSAFLEDIIEGKDIAELKKKGSLASLEQIHASSSYDRMSDQIFALPEDQGYILRRNIFAKKCLMPDGDKKVFLSPTQTEVRAIATFSHTGQYSSWCVDLETGAGAQLQAQQRVSYVLANPRKLEQVKAGLTRIREVLDDASLLSDLSPQERAALAQFDEMSVERIDDIMTEIDSGLKKNALLETHWAVALGVGAFAMIAGGTAFFAGGDIWNTLKLNTVGADLAPHRQQVEVEQSLLNDELVSAREFYEAGKVNRADAALLRSEQHLRKVKEGLYKARSLSKGRWNQKTVERMEKMVAAAEKELHQVQEELFRRVEEDVGVFREGREQARAASKNEETDHDDDNNPPTAGGAASGAIAAASTTTEPIETEEAVSENAAEYTDHVAWVDGVMTPLPAGFADLANTCMSAVDFEAIVNQEVSGSPRQVVDPFIAMHNAALEGVDATALRMTESGMAAVDASEQEAAPSMSGLAAGMTMRPVAAPAFSVRPMVVRSVLSPVR